MSHFPFLPTSNAAGESTAVIATVGASSAAVTVKGPQVLLSVGGQPMFFRFGNAKTTAVSSANGIRLPANSVSVFTLPESANTILHIREGTNSTLSVQSGNSIP